MTKNHSVLITGGSGFFGNAMVKYLLDNDLSDRICIYSRDEYKQAIMRRRFNNDERLRFFIGDVRDPLRLRRAIKGVDMVFHAAALKRIEVGAYNPHEMVETNVRGTQNVIDACIDEDSKAVLLSTDKACEPVSAYGYSKALAESLFQAAGPGFSITRYGNVANSTGSVIPTWREMIAEGATSVPVTDPDCTRFFMWEKEAVDLVLNAARRMSPNISIPVLPAYRLGDLAEAMGVEMDIKGLPAYEKKHESMRPGETSEDAKRLTVEDLREMLKHV